MSFFKVVSIWCFVVALASSKPAPSPAAQQTTSTSSARAVSSTACGDVISQVNEGFIFIEASLVYDCYTTVPFIDAVALRFIDYYNTTLQFQSTLAYLRNPPASYQQPAIDVEKRLIEIQQNITNGHYKNQYEFEASVQSLVYQMHDSHVELYAGILSSFTFGNLYDIMSVSIDGKQAPQIYLADDIIDSQDGSFTPSPIVSFNGGDPVNYLKRFAAINSPGMLEPHADWNQLMYSPAQDILGVYDVFGWDATFYPGDNLTFVLANGTTVESYWVGIYQNFGDDTGPLTTGGDFYNYFVLGLLPASYDDEGDDSNTIDSNITTSLPSWNSIAAAYPSNPDVVQPELSVSGGGFLTGYFLNDSRIAVLSMPSFNELGTNIGSFSDSTAEFIERAKEAGLTRIVIDLQQNFGGSTLLAIHTFRQFFPNIEPFAGSRRRDHELANILGGAMTNFWDSLSEDPDLFDDYYDPLAADEWVVTDRLNAATGQNFSSWEEYYGPVSLNGDIFSLTEQYNLTSQIFVDDAFDGYVPAGYEEDFISSPPPFAAENIILLTDGICGSSCSLFVEMMTHEAGVRTVVVGGEPSSGPMQAASGTRGAALYYADYLDSDMAFAGLVNDTANTTLPEVRDPGMFTTYAGFTLRDQVRRDEDVPLQFQYLAADCRIYYTLANAFNMSRLWRDAASAIWNDTSLCVAESTGYVASSNTTEAKSPPASPAAPVEVDWAQSADAVSFNYVHYGVMLQDANRKSNTFTACSGNSGCRTGSCAVAYCMDDSVAPKKACTSSCSNIWEPCNGGTGYCVPNNDTPTKKAIGTGSKSSTGQVGVCMPNSGLPQLGCVATNSRFGSPPR